MRCIAQYREHKVGVRQEVKEDYATGKSRVLQHGFVAEFRQFGTLPHERELARVRFNFHGMYQEEDEATAIDPITGINSRLSVFDTDDAELVAQWAQWDKLESGGLPPGTVKGEIEQRLRDLAGEGFFVVEVERLPAPWPKYDALRGPNIPDRIAKQVADAGFDPQVVIAYERQEKNRPEVVAALEALGVPEPGEELVAA